MDPRLQKPQPTPARQIPVAAASQPAPTPAAPAPATPAPQAQPITVPPPTYQIVGQIPLAQPSGGAKPAQSTTVSAQAQATAQSDDELDRILQAVNNRVQAPIQPAPKKSAQIISKLAAKTPKPKMPGSSRPIGAMLAVVFVFVALTACAVIAYRQGGKSVALTGHNGTVGTSSQAAASIQTAGGTLVRPADLDSYSQDVQTKLNNLNDSGDFDTNSLSSSVLGL